MDVDTADLDAQIAALQAAKQRKLEQARKQQERQEREDAKVLIASTPGKKEKIAPLDDGRLPSPPKRPVFSANHAALLARAKAPVQVLPSLPQSGPSRMSNSLSAMRRPQVVPQSARARLDPPRLGAAEPGPSTSRAEQRAKPDRDEDEAEAEMGSRVQREEDSLAIIEKLKQGPREFGLDPEGEEAWEFVEPNSGIRLAKRVLAHSALQDHLYGRYFLPPSLLYSVIRLSRDGATYDVPVDGDWVTIAVVAERGEVRVSGSKAANDGDDDESEGEEEGDGKVMQKGDFSLASPTKKKRPQKRSGNGQQEDEWKKRRRPRKYINLRLAALPSRSKLLSDASTGPSGDALLQLLLFEADSVIRSEEKDENGDIKRTYKGGSGGAYERYCNLNVGDVVGIISPRVLRPLRSGNGAPHPLSLPLALNPNTADSVFLIGQSRDLGCCSAIQKDGKRCKTWVDLRQSQVCEYHVHLSVQRSRSGRAEFTASTSAYSLTANPTSLPPGKTAGINHRNKTGLLPATGAQSAPWGKDNGGGGATYVVGGNTIRTGARQDGGLSQFGEECLGEKLGRGRAEKRKRRLEAKEAEKMLEKLVSAGQGSVGAKLLKAVGVKNGEAGKGPQSGKGKRARGAVEAEEDEDEDEATKRTRPFSAESIKKIGFDPSTLARMAAVGKDEKRRKEETIALLKVPGEGFKFDPKKKVKVVNVRAPERPMPVEVAAVDLPGATSDSGGEEGMIDLD